MVWSLTTANGPWCLHLRRLWFPTAPHQQHSLLQSFRKVPTAPLWSIQTFPLTLSLVSSKHITFQKKDVTQLLIPVVALWAALELTLLYSFKQRSSIMVRYLPLMKETGAHEGDSLHSTSPVLRCLVKRTKAVHPRGTTYNLCLRQISTHSLKMSAQGQCKGNRDHLECRTKTQGAWNKQEQIQTRQMGASIWTWS